MDDEVLGKSMKKIYVRRGSSMKGGVYGTRVECNGIEIGKCKNNF